jgi:hypothetical protein
MANGNRYRCWVVKQKEATLTTIEAETSFLARQRLASRLGLKTFEIVAVRIDAGTKAA